MEKEHPEGLIAKTIDPRWTNPPDSFTKWWEPEKWEKGKGSIGGHPHARRNMSSTEGEPIWSGIPTKVAWNCARYRDEFNAARRR